MISSAKNVLRNCYPEILCFRDRQEEAIERLNARKSTLLLMPTGGGKSLVYQVPVLVNNGVGLVISPLVALMREQADKLSARGIQALSLGGLELREAQDELRRFSWEQGPSFLFTSPERAETDGFLEYLLRTYRSRVSLVAIDEAHCISQWGHDFRPPYKSLPFFLDRVFGPAGWPVTICMTATLDRHSETEILDDFRMNKSDVLRSSNMIRSNLNLYFRRFQDTNEKILALTDILESHRGKKIIVYAHLKHNKRAGTRALATHLNSLGHRAEAFDADLSLPEKDRILDRFSRGNIDVVCATGAFGMGIDIRDIRGVIHFLLPESLEQYYQEVGRAGRDSTEAFGVLLYTKKNSKVRHDMINASRTTGEKVMALWSKVIEPGRSAFKSLSPMESLQSQEGDYALFHAFQRIGAIDIVARGPARIEAFKAVSPAAAEFLKKVKSHSKIGHFPTAFGKMELDAAEGYSQLFDFYRRDQIKLVRSPVNYLIFKAKGLSIDQAEEIATSVNTKIDKRLADFDSLQDLIETHDRPDEALRQQFGDS